MNHKFLDRNLALEAVRVTEAAALSSSLHMGRGNEKAADQAAVNAMREFLIRFFVECGRYSVFLDWRELLVLYLVLH